VLSNQILLSL